MSWVDEEFADLDLGDARLNRRLVQLAETFARQPQASIPSACGGWSETKGAYRFFGT
ncbi:MAG: transposase, partial [Azoarcus sp.]|nr:transposase [Azoarcus sp.]